ncbi:MAG: putative methyltransferase [Pseudohongiellaceae bacterium]
MKINPTVHKSSMSKLAITALICCASVLTSLRPSLAQGFDKAALGAAIASAEREVTDFVRDDVRKPIEVLEFLGLAEGMTVLDLYAAGGYYTFILAKAVGPEGVVYAQNTPRGRRFIEDRQDITQGEALDQKIAKGKLNNVQQIIAPLEDIGIQAESLDLILVAQTLHDYYNPNPARALEMLLSLRRLLKPGGVIGITDHIGLPGFNNKELHRLEIDLAAEVATQAGFKVEQSQILRVSNDDHSRSIFDPRLNRATDRFLLKLSKPRQPH